VRYKTNKSQHVMTRCPNSTLSDQVLLDIPHMEGAMFNIKVIYKR